VPNPAWCICCLRETRWKVQVQLPAFIFDKSAQILCCCECGLGRTFPSPETGGTYYDDNLHYDEQFSSQHVLYREFAEDLLSTLDELVKPDGKCLLDIGCGGGFLVEAAETAGFKAEGIEANKNMVQWCVDRGLQVQQGDVTMLKNSNRRYDVIVLSAILEHVSEPQKLLRNCRQLLSTEGVLLIAQASYDGLLPTFFPWGWYGWQPKEHFWHFTPGSFAKLASESGFESSRTVRTSLHHPWFSEGGVKVLVGRNIAAVLARLGQFLHKGDAFNMVLVPVEEG